MWAPRPRCRGSGPLDPPAKAAYDRPLRRAQQLGRYHLIDRIAFGGMAEIYRTKTFDAQGHAHLVAVKRVLAHLAEDDDFIQMLVDEAKIASVLRHPSIARVYEFARAQKLDVVFARHPEKQHHAWRNLTSALNEKVSDWILDKPRDSMFPLSAACPAGWRRSLGKTALYHPCSGKSWRRQPPPGDGSGCESNSNPCMKAKATASTV